MIIGKTRDKIMTADPVVDISVDPSAIIRTADVLSGLKSIADKYTSSVNKKANAYADEVVKGSFDSDEELLRQAKESLDATYGVKKSEAQDNYAVKSGELSEKKSGLSVDRARALSRVEESYGAKADKLAEDIARKGLSHSTIADLAKNELSDKRSEELARVNYAYDGKVKAVEGKIERLTSAYETALKNYEITYAVQLEKDIAKLKSKRDRLADEYAKEHKDERSKLYGEYLARDKAQNEEYEAREGDYVGEKRENYLERYNYLVDQLAGKTAKSVANFIKSNESALKEYLGLYYDDFVKEVT